jgi:hypothetical protein
MIVPRQAMFLFQTKEVTKMDSKGRDRIVKDFRTRQNRQFIAIAAALFLVLLCGVVYKRPDLFGEYSKNALFGTQAVIIAAFIGVTFVNWRCPACTKYLGNDINRRICKKCGARLI